MQSKLKESFGQMLEPMLVERGFERIVLKSCMCPEELWRKGRLWFSCSFDWRDQDLDICLGHLYWFRDVMPRVIILGEYSSFVDFDPYERFKTDGLDGALSLVRDSFDRALEIYRACYEDLLQAKLQPKKEKYVKEYLMALGKEVQDEELEEYFA